ncbi:MAG: cytochrome c-type biogenesis protein CcmE [Myxococcota bacterium]|jgi:cytochrome c-type biogenesis protein CcmE
MAAAKTFSKEPRTLKQNVLGLAFPAFVVLCVLGGLALVVQSSTTGGVYDMTLQELLAESDEYVGRDVRVNGVVQANTFRELPGDGINIEFAIGDAEGNVMNVKFHQLLPDAFEEGRQVIVQGKLLSRTEIECSRLTVKCPSKYKDENAIGNTMPNGWKIDGEKPAETSTKPEGSGAY